MFTHFDLSPKLAFLLFNSISVSLGESCLNLPHPLTFLIV
jgi:hypothetical protein